jgi:hypothetical protein
MNDQTPPKVDSYLLEKKNQYQITDGIDIADFAKHDNTDMIENERYSRVLMEYSKVRDYHLLLINPLLSDEFMHDLECAGAIIMRAGEQCHQAPLTALMNITATKEKIGSQRCAMFYTTFIFSATVEPFCHTMYKCAYRFDFSSVTITFPKPHDRITTFQTVKHELLKKLYPIVEKRLAEYENRHFVIPDQERKKFHEIPDAVVYSVLAERGLIQMHYKDTYIYMTPLSLQNMDKVDYYKTMDTKLKLKDETVKRKKNKI